MTRLPQPTSEQCSENARTEHEGRTYMAAWYPQMGGYVGKCWVEIEKPAGLYEGDDEACFDVWVWHDGEFPFDDGDERGRKPAHLHHCAPSQFIEFGVLVRDAQKKLAGGSP